MKSTPPALTPASRCAIYVRVSSDQQVDKYGLKAQQTETRAAAKQRGYTVVAEFVDGGISGKDTTRAGLDQLRALVRARAIDVVLTQHHDRFWRNAGEHLVFLRELDKHGVRHDYVSWTPEATKEGRLFETIQAGVAEYERELIRDRTMRGSKEKARQGLHPNGPPPYGYRRDASALGGLAVDEPKASVVRRIFEWVADGASINAVVQRLAAQGIASSRAARWSGTSIRHILKNDVYLGAGIYNRRERDGKGAVPRPESEWIRYKVTPLVARALAERARAQLQRNVSLLGGRPSRRPFLLGGLLFCACGRRMHGHTRDPNPSQYRCCGRLEPDAALRCGVSVRAAGLEELVWITLVNLVNDPDMLQTEAKKSRLGIDARRVDAQTDLGELKASLAKIAKSRARLIHLFTSEEIERPEFDREARPLALEAKRLEQAIAATEARVVAGQADADRHASTVRWCKLVARGLDRLDAAGRQAFLRKIETRVTVYADRVEISGAFGLDVPTEGEGRDKTREQTPGLPGQTSARLAHYFLKVPLGSLGA
jgi:site-specific DNA recombinase